MHFNSNLGCLEHALTTRNVSVYVTFDVETAANSKVLSVSDIFRGMSSVQRDTLARIFPNECLPVR
jgi:hypothetical protein